MGSSNHDCGVLPWVCMAFSDSKSYVLVYHDNRNVYSIQQDRKIIVDAILPSYSCVKPLVRFFSCIIKHALTSEHNASCTGLSNAQQDII